MLWFSPSFNGKDHLSVCMTSLRQVQIVTKSYVSHKIFSVVSIVEFNINNGKNSMLTTDVRLVWGRSCLNDKSSNIVEHSWDRFYITNLNRTSNHKQLYKKVSSSSSIWKRNKKILIPKEPFICHPVVQTISFGHRPNH